MMRHNIAEVKELLKDSAKNGKNVYCHWESSVWRIHKVTQRKNEIWVHTILSYSFVVNDRMRFDVR